MLFWVICGAMLLAVGAAILTPFLRASRGDEGPAPAAAFDLQVYRDQLREVDRDLERGVIGAEDADRLRREIGRKVLDADRRLADATPSARGKTGWVGIVLALILALGGSVWLYLREGAPGMPDLPLTKRIAAAQEVYDSRPSQAEAEANTPPLPADEIDPEYEALMIKLRAAVTKKPNDPQGLSLLALHESRLGNLDAAITAQRHLIEVKGNAASAEDQITLAGLMTEAAGGLITPEAEAELLAALELDPRDPQARYMLGILMAQNGRPDRAFPVWRDLLAESPAGAPWIAPIRATIQDLAWLAGEPNYVPPEIPAALPGPDADAMAAVSEMTPEERQKMVQSMVAQLEARLADQGGTPEEWSRLITSLAVIGDGDRARAILNEAQTRFADMPGALAIINAGANQAGLTE